MPVLRLFAAAREAAGTGRDVVAGDTVAAVLTAARERYGPAFAAVLDRSRVWVNGDPADPADAVGDNDEVAILPPVSGGALIIGPAPQASWPTSGPAPQASWPQR